MATLVTGGAGFVGSHVVERLTGRGEQVVALDDVNDCSSPEAKERNLSAAAVSSLLTIVRGDSTQDDDVTAAFAVAPVHHVVHLAARVGVRPSLSDPLLYERVNVQGTLRLLEASRLAEVGRFVFASSSSVCGGSAAVPFTESDAADHPISPHAATKRAAELHCHTFAYLYGLPMTCLRLSTIYGSRQRPDLAIHAFTRAIFAGAPIRVFGDGGTARDYTFVSDIMNGVLAALDRPQPFAYEVMNLGNSHPVTLTELITAFEAALGRAAHLIQEQEQPGDVRMTCADTSKAERLIGYHPRVSIAEGPEAFCAWFACEQAPALVGRPHP